MSKSDREELERLRRDALRANQRAGRKLARLRRERNVTESGGIDPRVSKDRISRMNRIQLRAYLNRAEKFIDRKTQFVGLARGEPVTKKTFDAYKRAERIANQQRLEFLEKIKDIPSPNARATVGDFISQFGSDRFKREMLVDTPTKSVKRDSTDFESERGMKLITEALLRETQPGARAKRVAEWRDQIDKMLADIGDSKLANRIRGLSDKQLEIMWLGSGFVNSIVSAYETMKGAFGRYNDEVHRNEMEELDHLTTWASGL